MDLKQLFAGISQDWLNIIKKHSNDLLSALKCIDFKTATPDLANLFNVFRYCPYDDLAVVLIGQDPYHDGSAQGLAFSADKITPSLRNIFECLHHCGLTNTYTSYYEGKTNMANTHSYNHNGSLILWAKSGVLLLNIALTTIKGSARCHMDIWRNFTNGIIRTLVETYPKSLVFILLGNEAQSLEPIINSGSSNSASIVSNSNATFANTTNVIVNNSTNAIVSDPANTAAKISTNTTIRNHTILRWGHPSPLNQINTTDNPRNFKYCDVFIKASRQVSWQINWARISPQKCTEDDPYPVDNCTYIFTDGAAHANGKPNCKSSWSFYITDGTYKILNCGLVDGDAQSNNRGELSAILRGLWALWWFRDIFTKPYKLVSDSKYAIDCITDYWFRWTASTHNGTCANMPAITNKKNIDLIEPAAMLIKKMQVTAIHINSHQKEPEESDTLEWFLWKCNKLVDTYCTEVLVSS